MPKQKTDDLIQLINSLTRAEKRHFRLFVKRNQASEDILFLQLFDFLEKRNEYDEELILKKLPGIKKRQLSNLKAHLYKQLLISLRLLATKSAPDIQIREMLDYARVLYDKGLYRQSLDILSKAKIKAENASFHPLNLEILEFEKHIEGQYITRSLEGRAEELSRNAEILSEKIYKSNLLSNLALQLYGLYLKVGFVKNQKDYYYLKEFFNSKLPDYNYQELDFMSKMHFCQVHIWYFHVTQEFAYSYRWARKWVDLFDEYPEMIPIHTSLYLKALHNLLSALYNALLIDKMELALEALKELPKKLDISAQKNVEGLYNLYLYIHQIKLHFIKGTFSEGTKLVPELIEKIEQNEYTWDDHRIMLFYYRIACLYFGSGDNDNAITYLNLIINQKNPDYRTDIQSFSRILNLIAHFELGNAQLVEYQVKSVYRFLGKMGDLGAVQKEIFRFLRRLPRIREEDLKEAFIELKNKLLSLKEDPFEKRPYLYLDIISWLESKIENKPVQDIIRAKYERSQKKT